MTVGELHRGPRLVDQVADQIRDLIITGELAGGKQLLQIELSRQLRVSRTPLREAFRILERDGLVRTVNNNRTVEVVRVTREDLLDMFRLRERTDALAAGQAAARGVSQADADRARALLDQLESHTTGSFEPTARIRAHADFHELIGTASRNGAMETLRSVIRTSCAAMYLPLHGEPDSIHVKRDGQVRPLGEILSEADAQHRQILEHILAGRVKPAERAARDHVVRTMRMLSNYEEWSQSFSPAQVTR